MAYEDYQRIRIAVNDGICRATIDIPPINLLDVRVVIARAKLAVDVAVGGQTRDVEIGELPV